MTVAIPISADPSGTVRAINQIGDALRRAGQEAKALRDIDLSHPELAGMGGDLQAVAKNLQDLLRVGRGGTAAAARKIFGLPQQYDATSFDHIQERLADSRRYFPDEAAHKRFVSTVGRYIFNGTQLAPQQPPPEAPPGGGPGMPPLRPPLSPGGGGPASGFAGMAGGALGGIASGATAALPWLLGMAGLQKIGTMASEAVGNARSEAIDNDKLLRTIHELSDSNTFEGLRDSVRATASALWVTYGEAQRMALTWAKTTNELDSGAINSGVRFAGGFGRGYGMDPGAAVAGFAKASWLGEDPRRFAGILATAISDGKQGGQAEQVMQALLRWSESASRTLMDHTNIEGFASMYAAMNGSGIIGLKGAGAEAAIGTIDSTIKQGGAAGDASKAFIYRALARRGITDPYQVEHLLEGGMFEKVGGETLYSILGGEVDKQYAGLPYYQGLHARRQLLGGTQRLQEQMRGLSPRSVTALGDLFKDLDIDPNRMNPSAMEKILDIQSAWGGGSPGATDKYRRELLARGDLSADERSRIVEAKDGSPELLKALIRPLAEHGMGGTMGTDTERAAADFTNALTGAGTGLVPVLNDMKEVLSDLGSVLKDLSTSFGDRWREGTREIIPAQLRMSAAPWAKRAESGSRVMGEAQFSAMAYLEGQPGWSHDDAAAAVANLNRESGLNPAARDSTNHLGIGQWDAERQADFEKWAGHPLAGSTRQEQLDFVVWEMNNKKKGAWNHMRAAVGAAAKAAIFNDEYEVSAVTSDARSADAATLAGTPIPAGGGGGGQSPINVRVSIDPLQVQHRDASQREMAREYLPVVVQPSAAPTGAR